MRLVPWRSLSIALFLAPIWRWCLLVNVPIAIATAVFAVSIVRESKAHGNTSYDIPGAVTVTAGHTALIAAGTLLVVVEPSGMYR